MSVKRFQVEPGSANATILHEARDITVGICSVEPRIVGFTLFGSRTKGYEEPDSDVDIAAFVDMSDFPLVPKGLEAGSFWRSFMPEDDKALRREARLIQIDIGDYLRDSFRPLGALGAKAHIIPVPMSDDYLEDIAQGYMVAAANKRRYQTMSEQILKRISAPEQDGEEIIAAELPKGDELGELREQVRLFDKLSPNAPKHLFNLTIGRQGKISAFRRTFLRTFASNDTAGEQGWELFTDHLARFEDSFKHPRDLSQIYYPRTLANAQETYAPTWTD
jgi:predicted nucleotidyltransferase